MCKTVAVAYDEVLESKFACKSCGCNYLSLCLCCGLLLGNNRRIKSLLVTFKDELDGTGLAVIGSPYGVFDKLIKLLALNEI